FACTQGLAPMVALLIKSGADVAASTKPGGTNCLMIASYKNNPQIVSDLVAAGADVNSRDETGLTPLMMAAAAGNAEIASTLITAGADVNAKNTEGHTALDLAEKPEVIDVLKKAGAKQVPEHREILT